jgi:hypothetical protein
MVGPAAQREGVAHLQAAMGLSERRACSIVGADRRMIRYRSTRPPDTELWTQLRDLANGGSASATGADARMLGDHPRHVDFGPAGGARS